VAGRVGNAEQGTDMGADQDKKNSPGINAGGWKNRRKTEKSALNPRPNLNKPLNSGAIGPVWKGR
jgi:hypothetical protein